MGIKTHLKYLRYVLRHKWFVFVAGRELKAPLWCRIVHDWSKFLPSEWRPYADHFYGKRLSEDPVFERARLYHQNRNDHHPEFWQMPKNGGAVLLEVPESAVREMVADWAGAGRGIHGRWELSKWFEANKHRIALHHKTAELVERLIYEVWPWA